jgi:hypothetical protein
MRLAVVLVISAVSSACGDDLSVVVDVTHPGPVAKTVISVYESESVDCPKIEFGDLDDDALASALVAEEIHGPDGAVVSGDLDGISRTEEKAIVARGYDDTGFLLTAGCTMKGVVKGKDRVVVDTVSSMIVSVLTETTDPAYQIAVLATKPDGTFLNKREVSWHVYAPIGTEPIAPSLATVVGDSEWQPPRGSCTNGNGVARIHPVPPSLLGGFATRIRASWAANTLPLETALSRADVSLGYPLRPPASAKHACAVKVSGTQRRLVCLDTDIGGNPIARELSISVGAGRASLTSTGTVSLTTQPVGVFAKPGVTNGDSDVFAIDVNGTQRAVFSSASVSPTLCGGCTITDYLYMPSCNAPDNVAKIVLQTDATTLGVIQATGGTMLPLGTFADMSISDLELKSSGCVNQISAMSTKLDRQVVVFDVTTSDGTKLTRGFYNCDPSGCNKLLLPVPEGGVAFATSITGERRLVGPSLDATGLVMSSWVIRPTFDMITRIDLLLERDRLPAAQLPHELVIGQLDDDAGYDLIWDIPAMRGTTLELAYSRMAGDQRLEVVAPITNLQTDDLILEDLSGDGHPELVLVSAFGSGMLNTTPVIAIPTHVPPAATTTVAEDCK